MPKSGGSFASRVLSVDRVSDALFSAATLAGSTADVVIGVGMTGACRNVAFVDVAVTGVPSDKTALVLENATSCGYTRGAIKGNTTAASFTAVSFGANAKGCYVEGADLSQNAKATKIVLPPDTDARLFGNYGSRQLSPISLGNPVDVALSGTTLVATSSYMRVTSGTSLATINGGVAGDLLVLSATVPLSVVETGNLRLTGTLSLDSPQDTLTLLFDGQNWLQVAFSNNAPP